MVLLKKRKRLLTFRPLDRNIPYVRAVGYITRLDNQIRQVTGSQANQRRPNHPSGRAHLSKNGIFVPRADLSCVLSMIKTKIQSYQEDDIWMVCQGHVGLVSPRISTLPFLLVWQFVGWI